MREPAQQPISRQSGVLVVDKPIGPTSHDVVASARRLLRTRAVGHAGTLDPMASGVLVLLVGEGTKLSHHLTMNRKRYRAEVSFGRATDTLDALGATVEERALEADWLDPGQLAAALEAEHTRTLQIPPAYSAIKVDGRRAHRISRAGGTVALEPRPVHVDGITLLSANATRAEVELSVSKGYYVRSFARDLSEHLGVPGHLSSLRRQASGTFTLDDAVAWPPKEEVTLIPLAEAARRAFQIARLTPGGACRARQGRRLLPEDFEEDPTPVHAFADSTGGVVAWLDGSMQLVALGRRSEGAFAVVRGFADG